jgi:hypothetical protein
MFLMLILALIGMDIGLMQVAGSKAPSKRGWGGRFKLQSGHTLEVRMFVVA